MGIAPEPAGLAVNENGWGSQKLLPSFMNTLKNNSVQNWVISQKMQFYTFVSNTVTPFPYYNNFICLDLVKISARYARFHSHEWFVKTSVKSWALNYFHLLWSP